MPLPRSQPAPKIEAVDPPIITASIPKSEAPQLVHNRLTSLPEPGSRTAVYDISAHTVYLPNGERLEAHSGLGDHMDDPASHRVKMRGVTPPNVYNLTMRDSLFHGVQAIRLNPVDEGSFGRDGILAHSYMLGPNGQSNGCVSFKDYPAFRAQCGAARSIAWSWWRAAAMRRRRFVPPARRRSAAAGASPPPPRARPSPRRSGPSPAPSDRGHWNARRTPCYGRITLGAPVCNKTSFWSAAFPSTRPKRCSATFGKPLGAALKTMPDGEVGPRKHWISRIHYQVLSGHPELEAVQRPAPENGVERLFPRNAADSWLFKVKDGVERVRFGDPGWRIGYARDAINSYFVFKTLREKGELARHLRFQVSLASVNSALPPRIFPNTADIAKVRPGYTEALRGRGRHHRRSTSRTRISPSNGIARPRCRTPMARSPGYSADGAIERNVAQFRTLSPRIPETRRARLPLLLRHARRLAALCAGRSVRHRRARQRHRRGVGPPRRLDSHSGAARCEEAFFAPLKNLKPSGARVYLGAIHQWTVSRSALRTARKFLPEFGLAAYCGFGRIPPADMPAVLNEHLQAIKAAG